MTLKTSLHQEEDKTTMTSDNQKGRQQPENLTSTLTNDTPSHQAHKSVRKKELESQNSIESYLNLEDEVVEEQKGKVNVKCGGTVSNLNDQPLVSHSNKEIVPFMWTFDEENLIDDPYRFSYKNFIEYGLNMWAAVTNVDFQYVHPYDIDDDPIDVIFKFEKESKFTFSKVASKFIVIKIKDSIDAMMLCFPGKFCLCLLTILHKLPLAEMRGAYRKLRI